MPITGRLSFPPSRFFPFLTSPSASVCLRPPAFRFFSIVGEAMPPILAISTPRILPIFLTRAESLLCVCFLPEYRYGGTSTAGAIRSLHADGGVRRFYRGMAPALIQGPMSRFGDTAANAGSLALLGEFDSTKNLPVGVKTGFASTCAAGWRIFLMRTLHFCARLSGRYAATCATTV